MVSSMICIIIPVVSRITVLTSSCGIASVMVIVLGLAPRETTFWIAGRTFKVLMLNFLVLGETFLLSSIRPLVGVTCKKFIIKIARKAYLH